MSTRTSCVALLVVLACTATPTTKDEPMPTRQPERNPSSSADGFVPTWRDGDRWTVRYRVKVPNPAMVADPEPMFEERQWDYEVVGASAERVEIAARSERGGVDELWRLVFAPSGQLVRIDPPSGRQSIQIGTGPFFPLSLTWSDALANEWPAFPLDLSTGLASYGEDGIEQRLARADGAILVALRRSGMLHGVSTEKRMEQRWEDHRPWWSSLAIHSHTQYKGEDYDALEIEGHVVDWARKESQ